MSGGGKGRKSERQRLRELHAKGRHVIPCCHCAIEFPFAIMTLDHIQPHAHGGPLNFKNTVLCCAECNVERGCRDFWLFREWKRSQVLGETVDLSAEHPVRFEYVVKPRVKKPKKTTALLKQPFPALPKEYKCGADLADQPWVKKTTGAAPAPPAVPGSIDAFWLWAMRVKREEDL